MRSFVAFETGYNGTRPCVGWSPGSGLDSLPSEPFIISSMSIDSRFRCILRVRRGFADEVLGALNDGGGVFELSDDFLGFRGLTPGDIPDVDTDRVRTSDGLDTERDCAACGDTTVSLGSSSSMMEST